MPPAGGPRRPLEDRSTSRFCLSRLGSPTAANRPGVVERVHARESRHHMERFGAVLYSHQGGALRRRLRWFRGYGEELGAVPGTVQCNHGVLTTMRFEMKRPPQPVERLKAAEGKALKG